jgi:hypothetical protein
MPTHIEDINLIPIIQTTIFNHIHNNPLNNIIMLGDFNRDIALIGRQHNDTKTAPTQQDLDYLQTHYIYNISPQTPITHIKVETTTHQQAS